MEQKYYQKIIDTQIRIMQKNVRTKVLESGEIIIPLEMRKRLGIKIGDDVILSLSNNSLSIMTQREAIRRVQDRCKGIMPEGVSIVDELIADRRREAAME